MENYIKPDDIKNKKIFITGGTGFIGTKIIERLIDNNQVTAYDTMHRNSLKNTAFWNHPNLKVIQGDVLEKEKLQKAMAGSNIVIHMAAVAGIDTVIKSRTTTMRVNLIGTYNVIEAAMSIDKKTLERFVDFSTSEVYGSYSYKLDESNDTSTGAVGTARWTYAISKLAGEHFVHSYFEEFGLPGLSIRPFNIYGPGQVGKGAAHKFIIQAIKGEDITVVNNGDQIRCWCYIDDMVDATILCLQSDKAIGQIFNVGNPRGTITILSLAEKIKNLTESKSKIIFVSKNYADVYVRISSIEKAKKILGYDPKIGLDEGLRRTIDWYRSMQKNKKSY